MFDKSTLIKTKNGYKKISKINVGDVLHDGAKVDAIFKISHNKRDMFKLNNIIVSGTHKVYYKKKGWISVEDHPEAILIENYSEPIIYCLNTSSKRIIINETIFMDWDELTPTDMMKLKLWNFIPMESNFDAIHKYMESGLAGETKIKLLDGTIKNIKDIKPDDILENGDFVIATVEIDASDLNNIKCYNIKNNKIIGGPNLFMYHRNLGNLSTLGFKGVNVNNINKLYHLITDTDSFNIHNILVKDYNSGIENIIDLRDNLNRAF